MMKQGLTLLVVFLTFAAAALAQPSNDECATPIVIPDVTNYCSNVGAYNNIGATPTTYGPADCFGNTQNDVWFSFTAQNTDVTITVRGATPQNPGGTLQDPQIAIYYGTCGSTLNQLQCQNAPGGANIVEAYEGGLFVGSTYLIRIQGEAGQTGTFQICINNYNPPVKPTSDCPSASILCDKSSFVVQSVTGAGSNISEMNDATCFNNGAPGNFESNSTWFVWTCSKSGSLEFTLTPLNITDDLDFVVYKLPNGIGNCLGKQVLRCMASGQSQGVNSSPCLGPTGLRAGDPDVSEDAGCSEPGDDAWLSPLDMVQGETYALVVNNFTSTGNGFSIDFSGSGEFLGPNAAFKTVPAAVCLGTPVQVIDSSSFPIGAIKAWKWSFGADATPQTAQGKGPHTVSFGMSGLHPVVLTLETDLGCRVTDIQTVIVYPDVVVDTVLSAPDCNGGTNGQIEITNIADGTPPYQYSWEGGPFSANNTLSGLPVGVYSLVIRDANNCETNLDIPVKEKELTVDADVTPPLCNGDNNGIITLTVTNGTAPFLFNWGNGFISSNTQGGYSEGVYNILGQDAELCKGTFTVSITDHPELTLEMDTVDVNCFGTNDGIGIATPGGGVGNFSYRWSDAQSQTEAEAIQLAPGQYDVTVTDGNGCTITGGVFIVEPPDLVITLLDVVDLLCNGIPTGEIRLEGSGGRPPYTFSADGISFVPTDTLTALPAGDYWAKIKDSSGCIDSVAAQIDQPLPLTVDAQPADTTLDLGFSIKVNTFTTPVGRPITYAWTPALGLDCNNCAEPVITAINSQLYLIKISDETGCMATDTVRIQVRKDRPVYIPNVFKPDAGTYPNDHFTLFGGPAAQTILLLRIYDRWGALLYEAQNIALNEPNLGWDGTYNGQAVNSGVFTYVATVRFVDQVDVTYDGDVTVVR